MIGIQLKLICLFVKIYPIEILAFMIRVKEAQSILVQRVTQQLVVVGLSRVSLHAYSIATKVSKVALVKSNVVILATLGISISVLIALSNHYLILFVAKPLSPIEDCLSSQFTLLILIISHHK